MSKGGSLVKNTLIIAVGKLSTQFLTFLLLPLYTAFLSPDEYGALDLIVVYIGLLAPTLTAQMEMAVFRHLIDARKNTSKTPIVLSSSFAVAVGGIALGVLIACMFSIFIQNNLTPYITALFATTVLVNFFLQAARGLDRTDVYAVGSIITGLINTILSVIALTVLHMSLEGVLLASIIANLIGSLFLIYKTRVWKNIKPALVKKETVKSLLGYSWPLVPNHVALWGIGGISRSIIAGVLGLAAAGVYAAANKFTMIFSAFHNIFYMSWTESVSLHLGKPGDFLSNVTNSAFKIFGSLSLIIIAGSTVLFPFLVANEFADAKYYIPILILGGFFMSVVSHYGSIYLAAKETGKIAQLTLQAVIISTLLTLAGVWFIGLYAPAIAILVTYIYLAFRRHYEIQRLVKIKIKTSTYLPLVFIAIIVLILYYIDNTVANVASVIFAIIASVAINKNDIYKIKNIILKKGRA